MSDQQELPQWLVGRHLPACRMEGMGESVALVHYANDSVETLGRVSAATKGAAIMRALEVFKGLTAQNIILVPAPYEFAPEPEPQPARLTLVKPERRAKRYDPPGAPKPGPLAMGGDADPYGHHDSQ